MPPAFGERSLGPSRRKRSPSGRSRSPPAAIHAALRPRSALDARHLGRRYSPAPAGEPGGTTARQGAEGAAADRACRGKAGKTWATAAEALLFAERCSALSGTDTDFVMMITMAYTGMRWSEASGLPPGCVGGDTIDIDWKLYDLEARFYRGRPKDGSIRTADVPPFLAELLRRLPSGPAPIADALAGTRSRRGAPGASTSSWARGGRISAGRTTRREWCARRLTAGAPRKEGPAPAAGGAGPGRHERSVARDAAAAVAASGARRAVRTADGPGDPAPRGQGGQWALPRLRPDHPASPGRNRRQPQNEGRAMRGNGGGARPSPCRSRPGSLCGPG